MKKIYLFITIVCISISTKSQSCYDPYEDFVDPKPTTSLLHTNNTTKKSIYNLQGQLLWQGQDEKVDVSQWEQGVYLLRTKEKTYRWIKN